MKYRMTMVIDFESDHPIEPCTLIGLEAIDKAFETMPMPNPTQPEAGKNITVVIEKIDLDS